MGAKSARHFTRVGGYASIDRTGLNADRFVEGRRLSLNSPVTITSEFSFTRGVMQAVGQWPGHLPRTRLDMGINDNLLHRWKKAGFF